MSFLSKIFGSKKPEPGLPVEELARRLSTTPEALLHAPISYREVRIAKKSGGTRNLLVPSDPLKILQRTIHRRLLSRLLAHPAATGFQRGQSIATNAAPHVGADLIIKMDLKDFFTRTTAARLRAYFIKIGWSGPAADLLIKLTTHNGSLPQGAPTSPRLSNLVNFGLDARLFALATGVGAVYTRYADDMTFSLRDDAAAPALSLVNPKTQAVRPARPDSQGQRARIAAIINVTKSVVDDFGYKLHQDKKLQLRRRHDRMLVTGLVVNDRLNLPRATRKRLRAVAHHLKTNRPATLNEIQLKGWHSLESMLAAHRR